MLFHLIEWDCYSWLTSLEEFQMETNDMGMCLCLFQASGDNAQMEDKFILDWANERLKSQGEPPISSLRDPSLADSRPICAVLQSIVPNGVSKEMLTDNHLSNAVYVLSSCRKAGARVYALPEHICTCNQKMIMTIFACLIVLSYQVKVVTPGSPK